jgi:hypothetical protein
MVSTTPGSSTRGLFFTGVSKQNRELSDVTLHGMMNKFSSLPLRHDQGSGICNK